MKINLHRVLPLLLILWINAFTAVSSGLYIEIDKSDGSLIATAGKHFRWYRNNILLDEHSQKMKVKEAGRYVVEATNEEGKTTTAEITVQIDASGAVIRIFTIGDSTVQDYAAGYYPRKGWGQVLPGFFNSSGVQVINKAVGGTSSKSFYNSFWGPVKNSLSAGDYVFIQFGINDRNNADPNRYTPTGGEFEGYLTKYVNEARAKGAIPVLVTTLRRNAWNADGKTVYDSYHDHPVAVRTVAASLKVPLIDLDAKAKVLMEKAGMAYCTNFLYNNYVAGEYPNYPNGNTDNVHFQEMGANEMAKLVTDGIRELSGDANVSKLIPFLKPMYKLDVLVNPIGSDSYTTHSGSWPQDIGIHLKTVPLAKSVFKNWTSTAGSSVSTSRIYTFTSGATDSKYTAVYNGATTCNATISPAGTQEICEGESVLLTASAGSSFVWKNENGVIGSGQTLKAIENGSYTVEITSASNCKAVSQAVTVTVKPKTIWYEDKDGDGAGDEKVSLAACVKPAGFVAAGGDNCPQDIAKILPGKCGCNKTENSCIDCNGVLDGSAILDKCDRCVAGTTGKLPCLISTEAEDISCRYDGVPESTNLGYKGTSYINTENLAGASITLAVKSSVKQNALLSVRYSNGGKIDRSSTVVVNGDTLPQVISFPVDSYTQWKVVDITVPLADGNNTVTFVASTAEGLANIDQFGFITADVAPGECIITGSYVFDNSTKPKVFPNPFTTSVSISEKGKYVIYDQYGHIIESGISNENCNAGAMIPAGVYLLEVSEDEKIFRTVLYKY